MNVCSYYPDRQEEIAAVRFHEGQILKTMLWYHLSELPVVHDNIGGGLTQLETQDVQVVPHGTGHFLVIVGQDEVDQRGQRLLVVVDRMVVGTELDWVCGNVRKASVVAVMGNSKFDMGLFPGCKGAS